MSSADTWACTYFVSLLLFTLTVRDLCLCYNLSALSFTLIFQYLFVSSSVSLLLCLSLPSSRISILQFFSKKKKEAESLRSKFFKFPIAPEVKEVHFRILNEIYPSAEFLRRRFDLDHSSCSFCDSHIETTEHLSYECKCARAFWGDLYDWLFPKLISFSNLTNFHHS